MNTAVTVSHIERTPELLGQTVVVIGARNAADKVKARGTLIFMGVPAVAARAFASESHRQ
jgi:hypothetical protein